MYPVFEISSPSNKISPESGSSSPANKDYKVDLPAPDFPIIA